VLTAALAFMGGACGSSGTSLDALEREREEHARALERAYGLDPLASRGLAALPEGPQLLERPYPDLFEALRAKLPILSLRAEDVPSFSRLGRLDVREREARLERLLSREPVELAKTLARLYGYTFRLRDEPALCALAGTPLAARSSSKEAQAAYAALLQDGRGARRFPLEALGPLDRLSGRKPEPIASTARRLVAAGLDLGVLELDPRAIDLVDACLADERILRGAEALGAVRFAPSVALAEVPPAALSQLGAVEPKRLHPTLADLAHARGFSSLERLDVETAGAIVRLALADASGTVLAIEGALDTVSVRAAHAEKVASLRALAMPTTLLERLRRARRAGYRPEKLDDGAWDAMAAILREPGLVSVLEAAKAAWPALRMSNSAVIALRPLAPCRQPDDLLRAAAAAGASPQPDLGALAQALFELSSVPTGLPVLESLVATFPDVRLLTPHGIRRLANLAKRGLVPATVLSLDQNVQLAGVLDDALAEAIARAAKLPPAPPGG
jgi:hypothetical protein